MAYQRFDKRLNLPSSVRRPPWHTQCSRIWGNLFWRKDIESSLKFFGADWRHNHCHSTRHSVGRPWQLRTAHRSPGVFTCLGNFWHALPSSFSNFSCQSGLACCIMLWFSCHLFIHKPSQNLYQWHQMSNKFSNTFRTTRLYKLRWPSDFLTLILALI